MAQRLAGSVQDTTVRPDRAAGEVRFGFSDLVRSSRAVIRAGLALKTLHLLSRSSSYIP